MKCAILFLFLACSVWAAPTEENHLNELAAANTQFAAGVYKEILKTNQGNVIFSPFSAETVLALLSAGANGETKEELLRGLSLPNNQESIQKAFKEFLPSLTSDTEKLKLLSANKIYAANDVKLEKAFETVAVDIYKSAVEKIDFSKNIEAAATMNKWVEQQTHDKIKDLIKKDDLSDDTVLVLINALYMSAKWLHPFNEYATRPDKFFKTANEHVEVPTMNQISHFKYYDNTELGAQFLELPYDAEGLSMVIVLPHEKEGLTALEQDVGQLLKPQPMKRERVDVKLPRFLINTEIQFNDILKSLGVKKIFEDADLTGLATNRKNLYVSKVVQKAFINVTESGTEAAAATAVLIETRSGKIHIPPDFKFYADHPYFYYIKLKEIVLFAGKYKF